MIRVDRSAVDPPASLVDDDGPGKRELRRAIQHYQRRDAGTFKFKTYKGADVLRALESLFHGKCAYCEHRYASGAPADIEHYRPKGEVKGDTTHPGYWWLAAEWSNLLPSCIDCNRSRYHERVEGVPEFDDGETPGDVLLGKGSEFPIAGARAVCPADDCDAEDPLLIDPTRTNPSNHLSWKMHKNNHFATPLWKDEEQQLDKYGLASIEVFGLNRRALMEDRARIFLEVNSRGKTLARRVVRAASATGRALEEELEDIMDDLCTLRALAEPDQPFSWAAGQALEELLADISETLTAALR